MSRLSLAPNGHVIYRLKQPRPDGTSHVIFSPQSLLMRLSRLVALPGVHLTRYHGVFAPNHVVPESPGPLPGLHCRPRGRLDWATLLKRVFALEVLICTACGGERRARRPLEGSPPRSRRVRLPRRSSPTSVCRPSAHPEERAAGECLEGRPSPDRRTSSPQDRLPPTSPRRPVPGLTRTSTSGSPAPIPSPDRSSSIARSAGPSPHRGTCAPHVPRGVLPHHVAPCVPALPEESARFECLVRRYAKIGLKYRVFETWPPGET